MKNITKNLFSFAIIALLSFTQLKVYANNIYFNIDLKSAVYKVNTVKLSAKELYGTADEVELYNLIFKDRLILFSVLPSTLKWKEITAAEFKDKQINFEQLQQLMEKGFQAYLKSAGENNEQTKRNDITLVITKDGKYLAANFCLTEYFVLIKDPLLFANQLGDVFINTETPMLGVKAFETLFKQKFKHSSPNQWQDVSYTLGSYPFFNKPLNFLSGTEELVGKKAYRFWHYADWRVSDGYNKQRGIDRFLYVPDLGIVAGSYDFWFAKNVRKLTFSTLSTNYLTEKVMYPVLINGKVVTNAKL